MELKDVASAITDLAARIDKSTASIIKWGAGLEHGVPAELAEPLLLLAASCAAKERAIAQLGLSPAAKESL